MNCVLNIYIFLCRILNMIDGIILSFPFRIGLRSMQKRLQNNGSLMSKIFKAAKIMFPETHVFRSLLYRCKFCCK